MTQVTLRHRQEFVNALCDYRPSEAVQDVLSEIRLVILLSVTGGGRNTIINKLVETGRYHFIVSDTTRPPKKRDGKIETDGNPYHFRIEEEVLNDMQSGAYVAPELIHDQQISGMHLNELTKAKQSGKIAIKEVDLGGADAIAQIKPDTLFLFVVPPNFPEWMRRLKKRENMSEEELLNRMKTAEHILRTVLASNRYVCVVNDSLDEVVRTVDDYVNVKRHDEHDRAAKSAAMRIYHRILEQYPELTPR